MVIGIIAILLALLFPVLSKANAHARTIACQSNMRQLGQQLYMYANENGGWIIPMIDDPTAQGGLRGLGSLLPPKERWPAVVFKILGPTPETNEPADYVPKILTCPSDQDPVAAHTYVLSNAPGIHKCKLGSSDFNGLASSEVIIAAEKASDRNDYYIEPGLQDLSEVPAYYRHGLRRGANYLFFDSHVELRMPKDVIRALDPWETHDDAPAGN